MVTKSWPSRRTTPAVRKGDLRERQILDAVEKLQATRGYADMTVGDIAEAAGITRGALYFYFASKQGRAHGVGGTHRASPAGEVRCGAHRHCGPHP
jgi:hypothetical protein